MWKKRRAMVCIFAVIIHILYNLLTFNFKFRDIFGAITEHMPGNPNDLKEKLGIEEDQVPLESI